MELRKNWRFLVFVFFALLLAGLNMVVFMWVKPLLNYLIPFWADPYLAKADSLIFMTEPWQFLRPFATLPMAVFYHDAWFSSMIAVLTLVILQPSSVQKSSLLITYFLLWSAFGPIIHCLVPAAGPVFYQRMGYGDTFAGLEIAGETRKLSDFLWSSYTNRTFDGGAGISAMPSLHIATTFWMVLAVRKFARLWLVPMSLMATMIFVLSVALGWHYASDGFVGAVGCWLIWRGTISLLERANRKGHLSTVCRPVASITAV